MDASPFVEGGRVTLDPTGLESMNDGQVVGFDTFLLHDVENLQGFLAMFFLH